TSIAMPASARIAPIQSAPATSATPRSLGAFKRCIRSTTQVVGEGYRAVHFEAARAATAAEPYDVEHILDAAVDVDRHGWRRARIGTWRGGRRHGRILTDHH